VRTATPIREANREQDILTRVTKTEGGVGAEGSRKRNRSIGEENGGKGGKIYCPLAGFLLAGNQGEG